MASDRVNVAGVMMSREEEAEVEAERERLYGPKCRTLPRWPFITRSDATSFVARFFETLAYESVLSPTSGRDSAASRFRRIYLPLLVLFGLLIATMLVLSPLVITVANSNGAIIVRVMAVVGILIWISAFLGLKVWVNVSTHRTQCRHAMRNLGWCICTKCGYLIGRNCPMSCPECGLLQYDLRVNDDE